jgi:hypothetical protein
MDLKPADVYIPPDVDAVVRDIQPRTLVLVFDVTSTRRVPVANKVRVAVANRAAGMTASRLTRVVPDSVTITGPRRVVDTVRFVSTVDQTVTVRDTGDFIIPLDVKRLAAGVRVEPTEVRLLVQMPPVTHASDSAPMTALRTK